MEAMEIRKSAAELRAIWVLGNEYLQDTAPWATYKTNPDAAAAPIRLALNLIRVYAIVSRPFIPDAAAALMAAMGDDDWSWPDDLGEGAGRSVRGPWLCRARCVVRQDHGRPARGLGIALRGHARDPGIARLSAESG